MGGETELAITRELWRALRGAHQAEVQGQEVAKVLEAGSHGRPSRWVTGGSTGVK